MGGGWEAGLRPESTLVPGQHPADSWVGVGARVYRKPVAWPQPTNIGCRLQAFNGADCWLKAECQPGPGTDVPEARVQGGR